MKASPNMAPAARLTETKTIRFTLRGVNGIAAIPIRETALTAKTLSNA